MLAPRGRFRGCASWCTGPEEGAHQRGGSDLSLYSTAHQLVGVEDDSAGEFTFYDVDEADRDAAADG